MTENTIYLALTGLALTGWALVFVSVCTRFKGLWIAGTVVPVLLSVAYAVLLVKVLPFDRGGFASIEGVTSMFSKPYVALLGWVHYLAFDLFIGAWQARQANKEGLPFAVIIPSLMLTLVFGPLGLLCFFALRYFATSAGEKSQSTGGVNRKQASTSS